MNTHHKLLEEIATLAARRSDKELLLLFRRKIKKIYEEERELAQSLSKVISSAGGVGATRRFYQLDEIPKDNDSGLELVKRYEPDESVAHPILPEEIERQVVRFIKERKHEAALRKAGIAPPSSLALMGKPGTGKTSLARWIASDLDLPCLILNIAGVVTSYLGQTGQNLKKALDRAKLEPSLLLLDEFDALGYHRGDDSDVGEMRRVVTVLLQEIENWPEQSVVVAATNMPEQVDPAFKRRFSRWIEIPLPDTANRLQILKYYYQRVDFEAYLNVAAYALTKASGAELQEFIRRVRASEIVESISPKEAIWQEIERELESRELSENEKREFVGIAKSVDRKLFTLRRLGDALGLSHTTVKRLLS